MAATDEAAIIEADTQQLHSMGYAQELRRGLGTFSNFAISFSIISVLAGALTTFYLPLIAGGPAAINTSWIVIGFFALIVGMAMAEICSAMPTAGGLYYWSAKLAKNEQSGARWSWFTGWFNLLGQIGVIASVDYALSVFIAFFVVALRDVVVRDADPRLQERLHHLHLRPHRARPAEHLRGRARQEADGHQRVVARDRRRDHRRSR